MHVLLCPGDLSAGVPATMAVEAMAEGWRRRSPGDRLTCLPLSDGGDGLVDVVRSTLGGELVAVTVPGPLGRPVPASVLIIPSADVAAAGRSAAPVPPRSWGGTAVIETGQAVGPHLLSEEERAVAALHGTSEGVGRLLLVAMETGVSRLVVGAGHAAVHDGGLGMLSALGLPSARLLTGAVGMGSVAAEDLVGLAALRAELAAHDIVVAAATREPFVGPHGAGASLVARVGLEPVRAQEVDRGAGALARLLGVAPAGGLRQPLPGMAPGAGEASPRSTSPGSRPYGGAGGGVALALAALGGRLLDGGQAVAGLLALDAQVDVETLLVTATPVLDVEALRSGIVAAVGASGLARGVPTVVLAESVEVSRRQLARAGIAGAYALHESAGPFQAQTADRGDGFERLSRLSARVASTWSRG